MLTYMDDGMMTGTYDNTHDIPIYIDNGSTLNIMPTHFYDNAYVSLHLRVQNVVPAQPCVGKLGISLVLLNFLHCNFRLWFKTP